MSTGGTKPIVWAPNITPNPAIPPAPFPTNTPELAPAPAPPPAPPEPTGTAALETLRGQIAQLVSAQPCTAIQADISSAGAATLKGAAAPPAPDTVRKGLASMTIPGGVDWQVATIDPVFCPAIDVLQPVMRGAGAGGSILTLNLADGRTMLRDGEAIRPRIAMADFKAALRVDYVAHDGSVLHLYPQIADVKQRIAADPSARIFNAGEAVSLGEVSAGHPAWEVGPPYGIDMIIAIQSAQPLFDRPRPSNVETSADYLRDLRLAVDSAQKRGVRITGDLLMLDTLAK